MGYGKEFVVKEIVRGRYEVWLVEKITGTLIEKHGIFHNEDEAEMHADQLKGWADYNGYNDIS